MSRDLLLSGLLVLALTCTTEGHFFRSPYVDLTGAANRLVGEEDLTTDDALFLTPYIEVGELAEGRRLSEVVGLPNGGSVVQSFSGFLTVNQKANSNLFFWFFPALNGETKDVPVILWLQGGPGGESYAGKYNPAISHLIHSKGRHALESGINLQGIAIGDGWVDPRHQGTQYGAYLYQLGLIDAQQLTHFEAQQKTFARLIDSGDYLRAADVWQDLIGGNSAGTSYFTNVTGLTDPYNYLPSTEPSGSGNYNQYLGLKSTRKALHVGSLPYNDGAQSAAHLQADLMVSIKTAVEELLDANYRILFYSGQLDILVGAPLTENFLKRLQWKGAHKYYEASRTIYKVTAEDGTVAGYVRQVDNLYYAIIRKAGHILPTDQPRVAKDMITRFILKREF